MLPDLAAIRIALDEAGIGEYSVEETGLGRLVRVPADTIAGALAALKGSSMAFDFLVDQFGVDTGELVEVTYHIRSFSRGEDLYLRTQVAYDGTLASVWEVYPGALMPERETAEMFGLVLTGHPNPKRLLTTDAVGPLLRKSVPIRTSEEVRNR